MFSPPISTADVAARIRATTEYHAGPLTLYPAQYRAELNGKRLALSVSEFNLLARLMQWPGDVVTTGQLHAAIRSGDVDAIEAGNQVRPIICELRKKLPKDFIENVHGVGYRLNYDNR